MKRLFISILVITAISPALQAQSESFDIFTFVPGQEWQRSAGTDYLRFDLVRGNTWCIVLLYTSTGTNNSAEADFQLDWNDLTRYYSVTGEVSTEQSEVNGWKMILGSTTAMVDGQRVNLSIATFSCTTAHSTLMLMNNDFNNDLESDIAGFMATISPIPAPTAVQSVPGNNTLQPPIQAGASGTFPTPDRQPVVESIMMDDGWLVEATNDYVQCSRADIRVIQYFLTETPYPDKDGFWQQYLSRHFTTDRYNVYEQGLSYFSVEFASGNTVYKGDGQQYFVAWLVSYDLASAFVAITGSEAVFTQYFPEPKSLGEMARYNNFPVNQQSIQGDWADSNFGGAQMYEVNTGNYAGMSFASAASTFTFSGNSFRFFTQGATGMVGTAQTFQAEEIGTYDVNGYNLITNITSRTDHMTKITIPKQERVEYVVAFRFAKNAKILFLQNKQYSGMKYNLARKQ